MKRIHYTSLARSDLREIHGYIAADNPKAATQLVHSIRSRTNVLRDHPEAGRIRPECAVDLRSVATGNYVIFYRITETKVEIVRILHGSRDIIPVLKG